MRDNTPLSQMFETNLVSRSETASSAGIDWPKLPVQNASVFRGAEPPAVNSANQSTLTIRPSLPTDAEQSVEAGAEDKQNTSAGTGTHDLAHRGDSLEGMDVSSPDILQTSQDTEGDAKQVTKQHQDPYEPKGRMKDARKIHRSHHSDERKEGGDNERAAPQDRVFGTHRFTVINKAPESSHKKPSGSES